MTGKPSLLGGFGWRGLLLGASACLSLSCATATKVAPKEAPQASSQIAGGSATSTQETDQRGLGIDTGDSPSTVTQSGAGTHVALVDGFAEPLLALGGAVVLGLGLGLGLAVRAALRNRGALRSVVKAVESFAPASFRAEAAKMLDSVLAPGPITDATVDNLAAAATRAAKERAQAISLRDGTAAIVAEEAGRMKSRRT